MSVRENLKTLCLIPALSGHEQPVAAYMKKTLQENGTDVKTDTMGNVFTTIGGADPSLPSVMVFGHMDQLGFVVRAIDEDGFIRIERLGGVPERVMPARAVLVQTRGGKWIPGIIGLKSHHATTADEKYVVRKVEDSYIDIGADTKQEVLALGIEIGATVAYQPKSIDLCNDRVAATSLDNRIACTVVLELAARLKKNPVANTVHLAGTVQEEYNDRGAMLAARALKPDTAICIDICLEHGTPDMKKLCETRLGGGPVISLYNFHGRGTLNGVIPHPGMVRLIENAAKEKEIPLQRSVAVGLLTDLAYVQFENMGVMAVDIGVPCRYTHSPSEVCSLSDIEKTVDLIYEAIRLLPAADLAR